MVDIECRKILISIYQIWQMKTGRCLVYSPQLVYMYILSYAGTNLYPFGEGAGDTAGPQGDDEASQPIPVSVPVIFYRRKEFSFFVSS